jgi:hypothetical protein
MNPSQRKILLGAQPRFAAKFDGASYLRNANPVGMDLSGGEMIGDSDNKTFEVTKGNWADNGNHSAVRDTTYHHSGVASLKIVASGAGDNITNFESLPASAFATIVSGNKFTKEVWAYGSTSGITLTMRIGDQVVTGKVVYNAAAGTFTKLVFNFLATSSTVAQPIQLYASGAGTIWIDDVSLTQAFDGMGFVAFYGTAVQDGGIFVHMNNFGPSSTNNGWALLTRTSNRLDVDLNDGVNRSANIQTVTYANGGWQIIVFTYDRVGNSTLYVNGLLVGSLSITGIGNVTTADILAIGKVGTSGAFCS